MFGYLWSGFGEREARKARVVIAQRSPNPTQCQHQLSLQGSIAPMDAEM